MPDKSEGVVVARRLATQKSHGRARREPCQPIAMPTECHGKKVKRVITMRANPR
jgi:hypothetical protein